MDKKNEYVKKLHAKIDEWNADIDKLVAKKDRLEANARLEYQERIEEIKKKRDDLKENISEINQASEGAWQDLKAGVDLSWEAMNQAIRSAASKFKS